MERDYERHTSRQRGSYCAAAADFRGRLATRPPPAPTLSSALLAASAVAHSQRRTAGRPRGFTGATGFWRDAARSHQSQPARTRNGDRRRWAISLLAQSHLPGIHALLLGYRHHGQFTVDDAPAAARAIHHAPGRDRARGTLP